MSHFLLFGASGMVGQGVLRACLADTRVTTVVSVVRAPTHQTNPKLTEIVLPDLNFIDSMKDRLTGFDAGLFCAGISSAGMAEAEYTKTTYTLTLKIAALLKEQNPDMVFCYITGAGTDSTEQGRSMWARVKGRTENALLSLNFKAAYMFRPGMIQPLHGIRSKTTWVRVFYAVTGPIYPVVKALLPNLVTTTGQLGHAMVEVAINGYGKPILEMADINKIE